MTAEDRRTDDETRGRIETLLDGIDERDLAVLKFERRMGWLGWTVIVLSAVTLALSVGLGITLIHLHSQAGDRRDEQVAQIDRNTKAIEVGCKLLSNIASQAGVIGTGSDISEATRVQKDLVALVFDVSIRGMTRAERKRFDGLYAKFLKAGPYVKLPNCKQVAQHPETVLQPKTRP